MLGANMGILDEILDGLKKAADDQFGGPTPMAERLGVNPPTISRWLNRKRAPSLDQLAPILDAIGAKIIFPGEQKESARDVQWVDAKMVPAGDGQKMPIAEDYFAVPLVGEAGAGPGVMPNDEIKSWVLVYRHQNAVRFKRNLLAVEIDKGSTSMVPLLRPGDVVLVDRDDFRPDKPGGIFLVREPGQDGGAMVKRVAAKKSNGDTLITFYSDNALENPPSVYSLREFYDNEISKAIVGRCVWSWSDLTGK